MERIDIPFERAFALLSSSPLTYPPLLVVGVRPYTFDPQEEGDPPRPGWAMLRCGSDLGWTIRSVTAFPEEGGRVFIPDAERTDPQGRPVVWTLVPLTLASWASYAQVNHVVGYEHLRERLTTDNDLQNFYVTSFLAGYWRDQWAKQGPSAPPG